jgi:hypothetical protein
MNYAQIVDGIVVNVIVADADFVAQSNLDYVLLSRGGIGWTYDSTANVFIAPQPYPSWTLDDNYDWQPPVPQPLAPPLTYWDEETQTWLPFERP